MDLPEPQELASIHPMMFEGDPLFQAGHVYDATPDWEPFISDTDLMLDGSTDQPMAGSCELLESRALQVCALSYTETIHSCSQRSLPKSYETAMVGLDGINCQLATSVGRTHLENSNTNQLCTSYLSAIQEVVPVDLSTAANYGFVPLVRNQFTRSTNLSPIPASVMSQYSFPLPVDMRSSSNLKMAALPPSQDTPANGVDHVDYPHNAHLASGPQKLTSRRLPVEAVNILQDWLIRHYLHPYPTPEEHATLASKTGLGVRQVKDWFNRTRSRKMATAGFEDANENPAVETSPIEKYSDSEREIASSTAIRGHNDGFGPKSLPLDILNTSTELGKTPMQRYLSTPPEDDPAPFSAIEQAANTATMSTNQRKPSIQSLSSGSCLVSGQGSSVALEVSGKVFDNISSAGISSGGSGISGTSGASHASWAGRRGRRKLFRSSIDRSQRRSRISSPALVSPSKLSHALEEPPKPKGTPPKPTTPSKQIYCCTWCSSRFARPSDWRRHEESIHCPQTEWICLYQKTADHLGNRCEFCYCAKPTLEHYQLKHKAADCLRKPFRDRAFDRKDHLRQHFKQVHDLKDAPSNIDLWSRPIANATPEGGWLCGFCHAPLQTWSDRMDHVRRHYESGLTMDSWSLAIDRQFPPRASRTSLPMAFSFGCSECHRNFRSRSELEAHQNLPHLPRSAWTCGDFLSSLLSVIPSSFNTQLFGQDKQLSFRCHYCYKPVTFECVTAWRVAITRHIRQEHNLASCDSSSSDFGHFQTHLMEAHRLSFGSVCAISNNGSTYEITTTANRTNLCSWLTRR
jgi:hypothetical protein